MLLLQLQCYQTIVLWADKVPLLGWDCSHFHAAIYFASEAPWELGTLPNANTQGEKLVVPFRAARTHELEMPPHGPFTSFHLHILTTSIFFFYNMNISLLYLYLYIYNCCLSTVVSIFPPPLPAPPQPSPPPTLDPIPHWLCPCVLYTCSLMTFHLSPVILLPASLWLLSVCSLFQCLWLYFVCFFLLLIMFQLKVRSYGICPSPPGLFHLA